MAMQTGASSSKVLILVGAGITGSIILKSGGLSDVISQLQELLKGVNEADIYPVSSKCDTSVLAAQIRQLAQEIRELSLSNPITILNGNSKYSGSYASYLVPAAALGAMGYCCMWWKGWSLSDVMFVTKENMANAVASVSKQLESMSEALAATRRHLTKRIENLDWKLEEQKEIAQQIANNVKEANSSISQIGVDIELMHQMVAGLEGKLELLESNQNKANSALWHLCQIAGGITDGLSSRFLQDVGSGLASRRKVTYEQNSSKGLRFIVDPTDLDTLEEPMVSIKKDSSDKVPVKNVFSMRTTVHRSYPVGVSIARDIVAGNS